MAPESQSGGGRQELIGRVEALEQAAQGLSTALAGKLGIEKVVQSAAITVPGYAADARQLNPANAGSLAERAAKLNGAYFVSKVLKEDFICNEEKWTEVRPFTYVVPQRSAVFMSVTFAYTQNRDARLEMFIANSYYCVDHLDMKDTRVQVSRAFIAGKGQSLEVHIGSVGTHVTTVRGSEDERFSHVDYLVIPVE